MENDENWYLRFGTAVLLSIWVTTTANISLAFAAWIGLILATLPYETDYVEGAMHSHNTHKKMQLPLRIFRFGKYLRKKEIKELSEYLGFWKFTKLLIFNEVYLPEAKMLDKEGFSGEPEISICNYDSHYYFTYPQGYIERMEAIDEGDKQTRWVGLYGE